MLKIGTCASLLTLALLTPSCRKENGRANAAEVPPVIAAALTTNALTTAPQGLLASRAASPVRWQHWDPAVLKHAAGARRLVFAFVGSAQYPGCVEALDAIDRDPALVARLNGEFVPVLVDGDLSRECLLAAGLLSQEIKLPVSFPFILVLSPEGNEVTWRPVAFVPGADLRELFEGASDVVSRMWAEDPEYVNRNSGKDHENRIARLPKARRRGRAHERSLSSRFCSRRSSRWERASWGASRETDTANFWPTPRPIRQWCVTTMRPSPCVR